MSTLHTSSRRLRSYALACLLVALTSPASFAQTKPAPKAAAKPAAKAEAAPAATRQLFSVTETVIKADKVQEYERLIKEEVNPAFKKAGYTERHIFTRGIFGDNYTYIVSLPLENYARYDTPGRLGASMGEEAFRALFAKLAACQVSSRTYAVRTMPEISHTTGAELGLAVITVRELVPGKKAEWRKYMQDHYLPAIKGSDSQGFLAYETTFGGSGNEVITLSLLKNYAELDGPNAISRKLGAEGYQKLLEKLPSGVIARSDRWILRLRKELSIMSDSAAKPVGKTASN